MNNRLVSRTAIFSSFLLLAALLAIPGMYSLGERTNAKNHIKSGCIGFLKKDTGRFKKEFSRAALADPSYIPLAQASATLDSPAPNSFNTLDSQRWASALRMIEGVCYIQIYNLK